MRAAAWVLAGAAAAAALGPPVAAQPERPTVDVYIRSQAGLPPSSAQGEIEVVDLGHHALDAVVSVVGHRTAQGWRVSYVCAQSPACDPKHFLLAKEFELPADAARRVDATLERLRAQPEPEVSTDTTCGLAVSVNDRGFKRAWRRACAAGPDVAQLEALLKAGLP
jgi:hypothetical protein